MPKRQRMNVSRGSKGRLERIRARDYWSWRLTLSVASFVVFLLWIFYRLASAPTPHS